MPCPNCGEDMEGDGFKVVRHCPNYEDHWDKEPDAGPLYCQPTLATAHDSPTSTNEGN